MVNFAVWLTWKGLSNMLFAHVNLAIIDQDSTTPKQEIGLLNKLALHLGSERDGVSQVGGVLEDHHFE